MNQPVLNIDVSKSYSYAKPFLAYGQPYSKPFSFEHTYDSTKKILGLLDNLEKNTGIKPKVVMEATGNFSKPLKLFFSNSGYQVIELNPLLTPKHKKNAQITKKAELSPAFELLLSIPGVGKLTAATIIGEIGDISRFTTVKKLVAFAGLDPSVYESGKFRSSHNRISKRGSTHLRKALYQAASAGIRKSNGSPNNSVLYAYYIKKVDEGKAKKVAIIAVVHKLLRIIYGIWKNGEFFRVD